MTRHARLRFGLMSSLLSAGLILVQPAAVGAASASVTINNYQFTPRSIAVLPGTTITWTNRQADDNHTVTSDTGAFDSGAIKKAGGTFSLTFSTAGTFAYHCTLHSTMHGTVVVSANAQEPPPTDTIGEGPAAPTPALPTPIALAIVGAAAVLGAGLPSAGMALVADKAAVGPAVRPDPVPQGLVERARNQRHVTPWRDVCFGALPLGISGRTGYHRILQ